VDTGFVLATADYTIRDEALRRMEADATKSLFFYSPQPDLMPGNSPRRPVWENRYAVSDGKAVRGQSWAWQWTGSDWGTGLHVSWWSSLHAIGANDIWWAEAMFSALSFGEAMTLPERVDSFARRVVGNGFLCGFFVWFGGTGEMLLPLSQGYLQQRVSLPLLAVYGLFAPPNPWDIRPAMRDFGYWLSTQLPRLDASYVAPAGGSPTRKKSLVAAAADKENFARKTRRTKPTVSEWPVAVFPITVGQSLSGVLLRGGQASTAGGFEFMVKNTCPPAGTATYKAMFVPFNIAAFMVAYGRISVTVNRKMPQIIISPLASHVHWGDMLATSVLGGSSMSVPGNWAWLNPAITPPLGISHHTAVFTPNDTTDYQPITYSVAVSTVLQVLEVATWPTAGNLTAGQALSASTLTGGVAPVPGVFAWDAHGTVPAAGVTEHLVRFTPTQTARYATPFPTANVSVMVV
jgi:hypothetical protein